MTPVLLVLAVWTVLSLVVLVGFCALLLGARAGAPAPFAAHDAGTAPRSASRSATAPRPAAPPTVAARPAAAARPAPDEILDLSSRVPGPRPDVDTESTAAQAGPAAR